MRSCSLGHKLNGFPTFLDALTEFCNKEACDGHSDTCFGLPCHSGLCVCQ